VAAIILREDLLERSPANIPAILEYKTMVAEPSLYNTPPCFTIYIVGLVLKWVKGIGGLTEMAARNRAKADLVYKAIDESGGFYKGHAKPDSRSVMNVTWRLPNEQLEEQFVAEGKKLALVGLKGHRSVGGIRASIYNYMPKEGVETLAQFMREFQKKNG
jgi:phosphoserine aminotransferase